MNANNRQVGGTHYRTSMQHWDMAADLKLGYFEGQISKYLTRHRFKKGREDAEKALHFAEKVRERAMFMGHLPIHAFPTAAYMVEYGEANKLTRDEMRAINRAVSWLNVTDLDVLIDTIKRIIDTTYGMPPLPVIEPQMLPQVRLPMPHSDIGTMSPDVANAVLHTPSQHAKEFFYGEPGPGYVDQGRDI
jgi:hypothetical protein